MSKFLLDLAEAHGFVLRKQGKTFGSNQCPSCGEGAAHSNRLCLWEGQDRKWRWKCHSCGDRGDAADFLVAVSGCSLRDALARLKDQMPAPMASGISAQLSQRAPEQNEHLVEVLKTLHRDGGRNVRDVIKALRSRGFTDKTIEAAVRRGLIRMLPAKPLEAFRFLCDTVGEGRLRQAGLWKEGSKWPAIAFRPLIFFLPSLTAAEFRILGEPKGTEPKGLRYGALTYPWWWIGSDDPSVTIGKMILVEGAMDLLSLVQLGLPPNQAIVGLPGTSSWRPEWLVKLHERHPAAQFVVALDNDKAGNLAAKAIGEFLDGRNMDWSRKTSGDCKDWNDLLLSQM